MKTINDGAAALVLLLGLAGCADKGAASITELRKLKEEMCACDRKPCVEQVLGKLQKLGAKHKDTTYSDAQKTQGFAVNDAIQKCMMRALKVDAARPPA